MGLPNRLPKGIKDNPESWPIIEVKGGDNPYEDPWEKVTKIA